MLDVECFTYLNRALESPIAPIVVLASNRGMCKIRGTDDIVAAHGIPTDFLARLLIIPTAAYEADEIKRIVRLRSSTEGVAMTDAAIDKIADHGVRISLRYCLQLLTPARYAFSVSFRTNTPFFCLLPLSREQKKPAPTKGGSEDHSLSPWLLFFNYGPGPPAAYPTPLSFLN